MKNTAKKYGKTIVLAIISLVLVVVGLLLAGLSNPKRFSLQVSDDRFIQAFAISGLVSTLTGVLLFLYVLKDTTASMSPDRQSRSNLGIGIGFLLQLAGFYLPSIMEIPREIGVALILAAIPVLAWGGMNYAQGKGHPRIWGLLAILGLPGLIVLILLPVRSHHEPSIGETS